MEIADFCELCLEWDWRRSGFMPHLGIRVQGVDSLSGPFLLQRACSRYIVSVDFQRRVKR